MVTTTKLLYCIVLLALILASCMARTVRQAGEVYNVGVDRQSNLLGTLNRHIAKRSAILNYPGGPHVPPIGDPLPS